MSANSPFYPLGIWVALARLAIEQRWRPIRSLTLAPLLQEDKVLDAIVTGLERPPGRRDSAGWISIAEALRKQTQTLSDSSRGGAMSDLALSKSCRLRSVPLESELDSFFHNLYVVWRLSVFAAAPRWSQLYLAWELHANSKLWYVIMNVTSICSWYNNLILRAWMLMHPYVWQYAQTNHLSSQAESNFSKLQL